MSDKNSKAPAAGAKDQPKDATDAKKAPKTKEALLNEEELVSHFQILPIEASNSPCFPFRV